MPFGPRADDGNDPKSSQVRQLISRCSLLVVELSGKFQ
jgi:hypothetical protein